MRHHSERNYINLRMYGFSSSASPFRWNSTAFNRPGGRIAKGKGSITGLETVLTWTTHANAESTETASSQRLIATVTCLRPSF